MSGIATAIVGSAVIGGIASDRASSRAADAQRGASDAAMMQANIAQEQWDKYNEMYAPLEQKYIDEAQNYDSPENFAKAAGDASATVSEQFSKARDRLGRTPGLDPSSGAYTSSLVGLDLAQAASDATQQNAARQRVKDTAFARKTDTLSLGKGLPAQASAGLSNAATTMSSIAGQQTSLAGKQAQATGQLFSPNNLMQIGRSTSNWLSSGTPAAYALGLSNVSPSNVAAANASADPIASLNASQGWTGIGL